MSRVAVIGLLVLQILGGAAFAQVVRLEGEVFGGRAVVEVAAGRDDEEIRSAMREAWRALRHAELATEGEDGAVARLNAAAGDDPRSAPPEVLALLGRALEFCRWSEGVHGPLGAWLYRLWGFRGPADTLPGGPGLERAVDLASCDRLAVNSDNGTATLVPPAQLDLWGFARGWAADRAIDVLVERGIHHASVTVPSVQRAIGTAPEQEGWPVRLVLEEPLEEIARGVVLRDRSIAVAALDDATVEIAGDRIAPYLDQSAGRPGEGVVAAAAVSELALDARGLAVTMFVSGARRGTFLAGKLRPVPSVRWLLGAGDGTPLVTDLRWSRNVLPGSGRP